LLGIWGVNFYPFKIGTQSEQKRGRTLLPETKAKSSEALKGKPRQPHSPETRTRISEAKKGKPRSPETRAKIAATSKGKTLSPEHRARLSEALKGKPRKPHSPETRARISEANKGKPQKPLTPEHRAQLSKMRKGKPRSPETRRKISEAKKGKPRKPHSPETRTRISEAQQRRWSERRKQPTEQLARGRKTALTLHLTPAERQTLHAWQRATTIPAGLARRGRIILLLADGMTITAITKTVGISRRFVYKWVQRFLEQGVEGLADKPGRGGRRLGLRPPAVSAPLHNRHVG
jgi:helix-turn-helix protein/NUMOD3 motif-containing protein